MRLHANSLKQENVMTRAHLCTVVRYIHVCTSSKRLPIFSASITQPIALGLCLDSLVSVQALLPTNQGKAKYQTLATPCYESSCDRQWMSDDHSTLPLADSFAFRIVTKHEVGVFQQRNSERAVLESDARNRFIRIMLGQLPHLFCRSQMSFSRYNG